MQNSETFSPAPKGKTLFTLITTLTLALTVLFWAGIKSFQWSGLPLYLIQLGLYLLFYGLAFWGLRRERLSLPFSPRRLLETFAWPLLSWLVFLLLIQLLDLTRLPQEFQSLQKQPAWTIAAKMVSTWLFVGLGEEVLFRGYFLPAIWRHFTCQADRRRTLKTLLLSSAFFSLWHLPVRLVSVLSGEMDWLTLLISLFVLFLMGLGFAWLYLRSENIYFTGLVHGLVDYPVIGLSTQAAPLILLVAIGCIELARRVSRKPVGVLTKVLTDNLLQ
jgi:membrane protease YdiL (CAAX protease family)